MVWQCINIWNRVFSALCDNFRIFFRIFGTPAPALLLADAPLYLFRRLIIFYAGG